METENEEREYCPVMVIECDHFIYVKDSNGDIAISHCTHPDNPSDYEGNCQHALCPIAIEETPDEHYTDLFPDRDRRPQLFAWAPGTYGHKCSECDCEFLGDKRASMCAPCAYGN